MTPERSCAHLLCLVEPSKMRQLAADEVEVAGGSEREGKQGVGCVTTICFGLSGALTGLGGASMAIEDPSGN